MDPIGCPNFQIDCKSPVIKFVKFVVMVMNIEMFLNFKETDT